MCFRCSGLDERGVSRSRDRDPQTSLLYLRLYQVLCRRLRGIYLPRSGAKIRIRDAACCGRCLAFRCAARSRVIEGLRSRGLYLGRLRSPSVRPAMCQPMPLTVEAAAVPPRAAAAGIMPAAVKVTDPELAARIRHHAWLFRWLRPAGAGFHNAPGFSRTVSESNIGSEGITRTARAARQKKEQRSWKATRPRCGRA
jgi:hypothetical protein